MYLSYMHYEEMALVIQRGEGMRALSDVEAVHLSTTPHVDGVPAKSASLFPPPVGDRDRRAAGLRRWRRRRRTRSAPDVSAEFQRVVHRAVPGEVVVLCWTKSELCGRAVISISSACVESATSATVTMATPSRTSNAISNGCALAPARRGPVRMAGPKAQAKTPC